MPESPPEVVSEGSSGVLTVGDRKETGEVTGEVTGEGSEGSSSVGVGDSVEEWKSPGKVSHAARKRRTNPVARITVTQTNPKSIFRRRFLLAERFRCSLYSLNSGSFKGEKFMKIPFWAMPENQSSAV